MLRQLRQLCCALLLLLCTGGGLVIAVPHHCVFDRLPRNVGEVTGGEEPASPVTVSVGSDWTPLRIKVFADDLEGLGGFCTRAGEHINMFFGKEMVCQEEDILTEEKVDILENVILPEAAKMHSERLLVRPLDGPLVVPRFREGSVCGKFPVPEEHHTDGVPDADMVLYATAVPTFKPTFAWAMPCATLGPRGRPVVGVINYNPRHIENTSQHIRVAVHEMAHALGFIVADMEEQALVKREEGVRGRSSVHVVNSRNTLEQARLHYGCESAPGMELEFAPPMRNPAAPGGKAPPPPPPPPPPAPKPASAASPPGPGQPPQISKPQTSQTQPSSAVQQPSAPSATQPASLPGSAAAPPVPRRPVIRRVTDAERRAEGERPRRPDAGRRSELTNGPPMYLPGRGPPGQNGRGYGLRGGGAAGQRGRPGAGGRGREPVGPVGGAGSAQALTLRAAQHISASTQAVTDGTLSTGTTLTVVEKQWRPSSWLGLMSHWGRRNAKDELMASFVVSGYYTAITMALFTDLGYYKANFEMAEPMSWGSGAGCALLTDKCVTDGATLYPDMFCTDSSDATLRCTSDRQSLGTCAIYQDDNIPPEFQYFATKQGSRRGAMMEYCPFIAPMNGTGCMDGDEAIMPGSVVGPSSRCLTGENLRMGSTVVGDVCVQLRCGEGTLSVRYRGSEEWHPCAPGQTLTPPAPFTAGSIRCPLFSDVCLTMLKHSDASSTDVESHPKHLAMIRNNDGSALAVTSAPLLLLLIVIGTVIVAP
ncbi:surface protease GP63, putative [Trypanosoma cruzi]|uniref:Leishmanolysin-like peptidase n=1 Tax=Trypanosoma cruzi (strain CL Brener) TaxID=353153 RepID=Q4DMD2_TRYCC|nr:surface protease GP63, putative [Trypanosoma cruzi]EAN93698.1 surface protease GP63, putative [Trypanosoma cruzi]|eukprot:XP_815549.1 surface protease GP63 [Trypanosoma cruzi strain CL Brener]